MGNPSCSIFAVRVHPSRTYDFSENSASADRLINALHQFESASSDRFSENGGFTCLVKQIYPLYRAITLTSCFFIMIYVKNNLVKEMMKKVFGLNRRKSGEVPLSNKHSKEHETAKKSLQSYFEWE